MDVTEQVSQLLKDLNARDAKAREGRMQDEASLLVEIASRYRNHVARSEWDQAQKCLALLSALVVSINCL
jgi:hypothetical protein